MPFLRRIVIRTRAWPILSFLYRSAYALSWWIFSSALKLALGSSLKALYLRRGAGRDAIVPGISDLDALTVMDLTGPVGDRALRRLWRFYGLFKRACPLLGEMQIADGPELDLFLKEGGLRAMESRVWSPPARPAPELERAFDRLDALHESIRAYLFLAQNCLDFDRWEGAVFGYKTAKHFLDVSRYARIWGPHRGGGSEGEPLLVERPGELEALKATLPSSRWSLLRDPSRMQREDGLWFMREAMACFEDLADPDAAAWLNAYGLEPADGAAACSPSPPPAAEFGEGIWEWRMRYLQSSDLPGDMKFYWDSLSGCLVVAPGLPPWEQFRAACERMRRWRIGDNAFRGPFWFLSQGALQALTLSPTMGNPFWSRTLAFSPGARAELWSAPLSRRPLWKRHYRVAWNWRGRGLRLPSPALVRRLVRSARAEYNLELRMPWERGSSRSFKFFSLLSRGLSLALFHDEGDARDPYDMDGLLDAAKVLWPQRRGALERIEGEFLNLVESEFERLDPEKIYFGSREILEFSGRGEGAIPS